MPSSDFLSARCTAPLALLVALALAACAGAPVPPERPPLPVATAWPGVPEPGGLDAAETPWQAYFVHPPLQALIARALAHNRDLRVAVARVAEARAQWGAQRAERLPAFALQAGVDRSRTPADLSVTRQAQLGSQYQVATAQASWELDFWGRIASLSDAALDHYLASAATRRAARLALVTQVAQGWLGLCELDERLELARRAEASRAETLRIFARRVALGAASRLQLTQMQTLLAQAQALVVQLELARAQQAQALELVVGQPLVLPPGASRLADLTLAPLHAGLPSDLLLARPDVVAAEHLLRAADGQVAAARALYFPRIALTGLYGTASSRLARLLDAGSAKWVLSPSGVLPVFDGGRREQAGELAQARREQALAAYERAIQVAFRDVADALVAGDALARQERIAQDALAVQAERARLSRLRHDSGAAALLEVLDAERDLLVAEQQLVQARRAGLSARVALYAALGGGSLVPAEDDAAAPPDAGPENRRPPNRETR